ncbi:hypothetical protein MXB_548 [Myxobolus squamalis]|nr:hypothetical protein MXB_548 [Myxobolus squamalis]
MGKKEKIAKLRQDKFYRLAKESGYRSRAAFKLIQLDRKYGFLNEARVLVDLCAAPGGWLQVAANTLPISSIIVGVDLVPIKAIRNVITHIGDITTDSCCKKIQNELKTWKADVVLHDGAPNLGKSWLADSFGQAKLTLSAIKLATQLLSPHGWFITKIFRSKDYINLLNLLSSLFKHVHSTKPIASRRESAEIFVVCQDFVGLKGFESDILNFKTVFKEAEIVKPPLTLKKLIFKKKPNRGGYDDDAAPLIYRRRSVSEFLSTEHPIEFLSETNEIYIDKDSFNSVTITPMEVKEYLKDVRVLGLREVKGLLLWRKKTSRIFGLNLKTINEEIPKLAETEDNNEEDDINDAKVQESKDAKKEAKKKKKIERLYNARNIHTVRELPITKEQVEFYRQKQRELDAQPIKKVLEARARKNKKKIRLLESTKAKAQKLLQGEGDLETDKLDQLLVEGI